MKDTQTKIAELSKVEKLSSEDIGFIYRVNIRDIPLELSAINESLRILNSFTDKKPLTEIIERLVDFKEMVIKTEYHENKLKMDFRKSNKTIIKNLREPLLSQSENFTKLIVNSSNIEKFNEEELKEFCNLIETIPQLEKVYIFTYIIDRIEDATHNSRTICTTIANSINNLNGLIHLTMLNDSIRINDVKKSVFNDYILYLLYCLDIKLSPVKTDYMNMKDNIIANLYDLYVREFDSQKEIDSCRQLLLMIATYTSLPSFTQYNRMMTVAEFI